jgi:hypothetical protein
MFLVGGLNVSMPTDQQSFIRLITCILLRHESSDNMCCAGMEWGSNEMPNGVCPDCGADTVDDEAYDQCGHSRTECETCDSAPCDQSC